MAERPLDGRRIVVTRPDARGLADALETLGAEVAVVPLVEIRPPETPVRAELDSYDWIVLTSVNGLAAVSDALGALRTETRVAAVGPVTAGAVRALGVEPAFVAPGASEEIAGGLGPLHGLRVLVPQADIASPQLADALRERGAAVDAVVAYRTVQLEPSPDGLSELRRADAVVLASGSAARSLAATGAASSAALLVCIGPKTAAVAGEVGLRVGLVADETTNEGIIRALVAHFAESQ